MRKIIIFIFLTSCMSCVFIRKDDSIDLGNRYRYIQDYPQTIIYHNSEKYEGTGVEIVAPIVLQYSYDKSFILAKTKDIETNDTIFWIIHKKNHNIEKYYDSIQYQNAIQNHNIDFK